jgi:hypothetical protein
MAMTLGQVFEPFIEQRPICVMARGVLENPHSIGFSGGQLPLEDERRLTPRFSVDTRSVVARPATK